MTRSDSAASRPRLRHIELLLDRSGSMDSIRADAEGGLRAFLAEQRQAAGHTTVTLWEFDHDHRRVYDTVPLAEVPDYRLRPRGRTALLDVVGEAIERLEERMLGLPVAWRPEVVVVIVTDGKENASRSFDLDTVKEMISAVQEGPGGWKFIYLAADPDAFTVADAMGIGRDTVLPMDRDATQSSMTSLGRMVSRGSSTGRYAFTDEERDAAR